MRNTLSDLNNHLFEQLERLNDDDLDEAGLEKELNRSCLRFDEQELTEAGLTVAKLKITVREKRKNR